MAGSFEDFFYPLSLADCWMLGKNYNVERNETFIMSQENESHDGNGPFAPGGHMVHAGGQAAHWDIQNKENSNLS